MYRILIVDDEPIEVKSLEFIITKRLPEMEILPSARSGRDAVEKAMSARPDIVLMDIQMPGINGIEAIREIIKTSPDACFIITSAYNYFDYAAQAIDLNVEEYLLKPIREEKLIETLTRVSEKISARRDRLRMEMELKEKLEMSIPYLEKGFINDICLSENNGGELHNYCRLFGAENENGYVVAIEFGESVCGEIHNRIGIGMKSEKLYSSYSSILKSKLRCAVGPVMLNRIIVYVFDGIDDNSFENKNNSIKYMNEFIESARELYPNISAGIGTRCGIDDAKRSYREALRAIKCLSAGDNGTVLHYSDIIEEEEQLDSDYSGTFENMIYIPMLNGDDGGAIMAFEACFGEMAAGCSDIEMLKNRCILLLAGFSNHWSCPFAKSSEVMTSVINAGSSEEIKSICEEHILYSVGQIASKKQKKVNSIIEKADEYIKENYMNEILLDDIARAVNLSPFYFSRFYKDKTGHGVIDNLTSYRIEKAKQLLADDDISVKEISHLVGYQDQNYFSKLFKKNTGMTASEYRENKLKR